MDRRVADQQMIKLTETIAAVGPRIDNLVESIDRVEKTLASHVAINYCENCAPNYYLKHFAFGMLILAIGVFVGPDKIATLCEKLIFKLL
jgi:hypothetical protein